MISDRDLVTVQHVGKPWTYGTMPRPNAEAAIAMQAHTSYRFEMIPVPSCRCCGEPAWPNLRCSKHQDRNPCAAEGCHRTRATHRDLRDDASLCGEHWRAFVPPGSPTRRAFNRLARVAKRAGYKRTDVWPEQLEARWWLIWRGVMRRVRRGAEGHIDKAAIERLFGWGDEE